MIISDVDADARSVSDFIEAFFLMLGVLVEQKTAKPENVGLKFRR